MPVIDLETKIKADIRICFDLSRSIDLHQVSTAATKEKAIAGLTSGLIGLNESVTWQAIHFGIRQKLTSKITAYHPPFHFRDEQQKGAFKYMVHDHYYENDNDGVIMKDVFDFRSPASFFGNVFDRFVLRSYLLKFLIARNQVIKEYAETGKWKSVLAESEY